MALPAGINPRSEAEWSRLLNSTNPEERKEPQEVLKALFPNDKSVFVGKAPEVKLGLIMAAQGEAPKAAAKASAPKAAAAAAPKAAAAAKTEAAPAGAPAPTQAAKDLAALRSEVSDLKDTVNILLELVQDSHLMLRGLVYVNPTAGEVIEDDDIRESLRGLLSPLGNE